MTKSRIHSLLPYLFISVICLCLFAKPLGSGDELWNYNFGKNIAEGLLPYKDFNIIQTPLSAYLAGFFMLCFGRGLITHRILGYLLAVSIYCTAFHLCKKISKSAFISFISVLLLFAVHYPYFIYNYNYLSLLLILLIFEVESTNESGNCTKHVFAGLLVGLTVLSKQSTGALIFFANIAICLYYLLRRKDRISAVILRVIASGVPMLCYIMYLLISGTFADFWEYAVAGVGTFTHRTTPVDLIRTGPGNIVFFILIIVCYVIISKKMIKKTFDHFLISMVAFNFSWIIVTYPLCDASHLLCLLIPLMPAGLRCITCKQYKDWEKYACIAVSVVVCCMAIVPFAAIGDEYTISNLNNLQGIVIETGVEERIETIGKYIKAKREEGFCVRIAADSSCAYTIPLDLYEKNWDMLLVGNLGYNDVESLLKEKQKTVYLVYKESLELNKQNHYELIDYIKNNYTKIEEVLNFDVYEKQD